MGTGIPGVPGSGGFGPHGGGGGGKRRRRKKKGAFGQFLKFARDLIVGIVIVCAIYLAIEAVPYLLKFEPGDIMNYSDANIFGKVEALRDGLRHKRGTSEMTFSHDGRKITFTDDNGTLTGIEAEGYDYGESGDFESDLEEARRLMKEWGLD